MKVTTMVHQDIRLVRVDKNLIFKKTLTCSNIKKSGYMKLS